MEEKETRTFHYLLIPIPIFLIVLGATLGKIGSQFVSIEKFNIFGFLNIFTISAIISEISRSIVLVVLYRKFDISFIYPITSISYVFILIISVVFFSDSFTIGKILGCIFISLGTYLISSVKIKKSNNK